MVVVLKLSHGEQVVPVILPFVHENLKELVKLLVDTFCLSIRLRVPGRRGHRLDSEESVQLTSETQDKLWPAV